MSFILEPLSEQSQRETRKAAAAARNPESLGWARFDDKPAPIKAMLAEESFQRRKRAYAQPPKQWLGEDSDPDRPEVQERRRISLAVLEKVTKDLECADA